MFGNLPDVDLGEGRTARDVSAAQAGSSSSSWGCGGAPPCRLALALVVDEQHVRVVGLEVDATLRVGRGTVERDELLEVVGILARRLSELITPIDDSPRGDTEALDLPVTRSNKSADRQRQRRQQSTRSKSRQSGAAAAERWQSSSRSACRQSEPVSGSSKQDSLVGTFEPPAGACASKSLRARPTRRITPELVPPVTTSAEVACAALARPLEKAD